MADINDLAKILEEIKKVLEQSAKAQVGAPGAATKLGAPKSMKDHFAAAFEKGKLGGMGKVPGVEFMGKASGTGAAYAGAAGAIMGPLVALGVEFAKLPGKIKEFAEGLHEANRQFAKLSPSMAMVMAQSDMQDMMRKMQMGEDLAGSAGNLANARGNLLDQTAPVETAFQNLQNNAGAIITGAMAEFLEQSEWAQQLADWVEEASDALDDILEWLNLKKEKDQQDTWEEEIANMAKNEDMKRIDRAQPVRQPPARDPRPNFPWDRR